MWNAQVGARNGANAPLSGLEIDRRNGSAKAGSLHLSGEAKTKAWQILSRSFPSQPGDEFHLTLQAKNEGVRQEGNPKQFGNNYASLTFFDAQGEFLQPARHTHLGGGDTDWRKLEVRGKAPEGASEVRVNFFLSMSGDSWFDDLVLTRREDSTPPTPTGKP